MMSMKEGPETDLSIEKVRDHLANERTFLSWIRTSIAVMAFGFVVEKFSLFLKQISLFLEKSHLGGILNANAIATGYSSMFGVALVAVGALLCLLALVKYKKIETQINSEKYEPTMVIDLLLGFLIFSIGLLLSIYLITQI